MRRILSILCSPVLFLVLASCSKEVKVEGITVVPGQCTLAVGESVQLKAEVMPADYAGTVNWMSSDGSKATVDNNGLVTAVASGNVTISASAGNMVSECRIEISGNQAAVGDYLFSDGTYAASPQDGKDIIGVIFWVGDPTAQDPSLKREHPECTHGLAVAIDGDDYSAWQSGYAAYGKTVGEWIDANLTDYFTVTSGMEMEDNINRTVGYNNTKAIEAFNASPDNAAWKVDAVEKAMAYRNYSPAPANTSDWYLPSVKELSLLCSGEVDGNVWDIKDNTAVKEIINKKLAAVENGAVLTDERYWSSSEGDVIRSFYINFELGLPNVTYVKDTDYLRLRFIIAF